MYVCVTYALLMLTFAYLRLAIVLYLCFTYALLMRAQQQGQDTYVPKQTGPGTPLP